VVTACPPSKGGREGGGGKKGQRVRKGCKQSTSTSLELSKDYKQLCQSFKGEREGGIGMQGGNWQAERLRHGLTYHSIGRDVFDLEGAFQRIIIVKDGCRRIEM
jgi:hypothetical protein